MKKFYLIALTDFESEILAIFNIKIMAKLSGIIHQVEFDKT